MPNTLQKWLSSPTISASLQSAAETQVEVKMDIDEYQRKAHTTSRSDDIEIFTLGLFGEAGSVASSIKKIRRENNAAAVVKKEIATELGDLLWYLAEIASFYEIKLSDVVDINLKKSKFLFNGDGSRLDAKAPPDQQFPKSVNLTFDPDGNKAQVRVNGKTFGDVLDDNAHDDDGYRFHDVFHFAYMTKLGWSPVVRKQLGLKRRYNADLDRVEDGARAIFLEEGISVFVFNQNVRTDEGVSAFSDRRNIPFSVLSAIKIMTKNVEVSVRDITAWRDAIALGFQMFDKLHENNGGRIFCDVEKGAMRFEAR